MRLIGTLVQSMAAYAILAVVYGQAPALVIRIDDSTDNLVITSDSANTQVSANGENAFISDPQIINRAGTGVTAELIEPPGGVTGVQTSSDAVGVIPLGGGQFELLFNSDDDGGPAVTVNCSLPQVFSCIAETAQAVDVGPIVYGVDSGIHIFVTSDVDPVTEPASLGILGVAVVITLLAHAASRQRTRGGVAI
jgi:hypothetical protein